MEVIITLIIVAVIVGVLAVGYYLLKPWVGGSSSAVQIPPAPRFEVPNAGQKFEEEADYGGGLRALTKDEIAAAQLRTTNIAANLGATVKTQVAKVEAEAEAIVTKAKTKAKAAVKKEVQKIRRKTA